MMVSLFSGLVVVVSGVIRLWLNLIIVSFGCMCSSGRVMVFWLGLILIRWLLFFGLIVIMILLM